MKRILGLVGWLGVILVVAAVVLWFSRPELQPWSQRVALAGLVATAVYALSQWRDMARSFQGKNVKYGSIAAGSVVLVLAILVGINWVASRQNKRWDVTQASQFTLADQTKKILGELKQPLVIRVFYARDSREYRDRIAEYTYISKQVSADFIDVERNNLDAEKFGITSVPTFVLDYGGRTEKATSADEQSITNALKKVLEGKTKKVYFLEGHGEHDTADDYSAIAEALKSDNFEVAKLPLAQQGKVPDDASVIVVAGPKSDLLPAEVDLLKAYLKKGGKLQLMLDPPEKGTAPDVPNLLALAKEWGATVGNDLIIDVSGLGQMIGTGASVPVAMPVQHAITSNFRIMTAFPIARSVTPVEGGVDGHMAQKFLETSPQSWAESDVKGLYATQRPERNVDKGDKAGPITLAVATSAPVQVDVNAPTEEARVETRVVIVGDSDFASNRAIGIQGNREMYLNMVNWLAQQEDLIAIRPRDPADRPLNMTEDQGRMIFWFTMGIVPIALFGTAVRMWWRRRS